jgi:glycylpeptide N-tetradecanoyltransferase
MEPPQNEINPSSSTTKQTRKKNKNKSNTKVDLSGINDVMKPVYQRMGKTESDSNHEFWKVQPVPKFAEMTSDEVTNSGYLTETLEGVRTVPFDLPSGYAWADFDFAVVQTDAANIPANIPANIENPSANTHKNHHVLIINQHMREVYEFLRDNYCTGEVEFQFNYSPELLLWAMCPPGYSKTLHLGIRDAKGSLVGFVSGAPMNLRIYNAHKRLVEINFLCVKQGERNNKLAPVLIEEVARRVRFLGMWQAIYTSTRVLPHSLATVNYYHRPLDVRRLIEMKFMNKRQGLTLASIIKLHALPAEPTINIRLLTARDVSGACQMLNKFLSAYHIAPEFTLEEFRHNFMPRDQIVYSYVVLGQSIGGDVKTESVKTESVRTDPVIIGFISFYKVQSLVVNESRHKELNAAYSYYNVAGRLSWQDLMLNALILAKKNGFDVFNCLDVMENSQFFDQLKFNKGTGNMRYHLYNWNCMPTRADGIGVVLK